MKSYFKIFIVFFLFAMSGCEKEEEIVDLDYLAPPSNLGATFNITQDNSGLVTITPTGQGAVLFNIDFGDGSTIAENVKAGDKVAHIYAEGEYEVEISGKNLNGETATGIQPLNVSFLAPENLEATITQDPSNNYRVTVAATATNAAMFEVYFGEMEAEEPVPLMPGETIEYIYGNVGTYTITVIALSGGAATTEFSQEIVITDPLFLPIDFESETLDYTFSNFGGGEGTGAPVVDNPDKSEANTSEKVASYTKVPASETWAGTTIPLAESVDFSETDYISIDVWSPIAGAEVLLKLENINNADIFVEAKATTTESNQWETLTFDFSGRDIAQEYGRLVLFFNFNIPGTGETYYFDNIKTTKLEQLKLPLNFESETLEYVWAGFGGASGSVIANPNVSGINTSNRVVELIKSNGAQTWGGINLTLDEPLDLSVGTTVSMKVWSPAAGASILFKLEDSNSPLGPNNSPSVFVEVSQNTTVANEWETLSFDLTSFADFDATAAYDRVVIFYDFGNPGAGESFYFDDITLALPGEGGSGDTPISAAPAPTLAEDNVISMFSGAYTNVLVDTWLTSWSGGSLEEVAIAGNDTKKYTELNFVGIETAAMPLDISAMTHMHVDIWTPNLTDFRIKLVDFGTDAAFGGGDDVEHEIAISEPSQGQWVSLEIPLSDFEGLITKKNIAQLIFSGNPTGSGTVFIDNVYFHN